MHKLTTWHLLAVIKSLQKYLPLRLKRSRTDIFTALSISFLSFSIEYNSVLQHTDFKYPQRKNKSKTQDLGSGVVISKMLLGY